MVVKVEEEVIKQVLHSTIMSACKKNLPYAVHFSIEGSLRLSLATEEIFLVNIKESGEGTAKYNKKRGRKSDSTTKSLGSTSKRKRGRPKKLQAQDEDGSDSDGNTEPLDYGSDQNESLSFPNLDAQMYGDENSDLPLMKQEEAIKQEQPSEADGSFPQQDLGMQALQNLAMQLSGSADQTPSDTVPSTSAENQNSAENQSGAMPRQKILSKAKKRSRKSGSPKPASPASKDYVCDVCGKAYVQFASLEAHVNKHLDVKPFKCDKCGKSYRSRQSLQTHSRMHAGQGYKCQVCAKQFICRSVFEIHQRFHTGEKPIKCDQCEKRFWNNSMLKIHKRGHTGEKPYKCAICDKHFSSLMYMKMHLKNTHAIERQYKCQYCSKDFTLERTLVQHERIHTGEKPFQCRFCGKSFTQGSGLRQHEMQQHSDEQLLPCKCCSRKFAKEEEVEKHELLHMTEKPLQCSICNKRFRTRESLIKHTKTHTGDKPYKCLFCDKTFSRMTHVKAHERTHTGEKPYKCKVEFCRASFTQSSHLRRHEKGVHGIVIPEKEPTAVSGSKVPQDEDENQTDTSGRYNPAVPLPPPPQDMPYDYHDYNVYNQNRTSDSIQKAMHRYMFHGYTSFLSRDMEQGYNNPNIPK